MKDYINEANDQTSVFSIKILAVCECTNDKTQRQRYEAVFKIQPGMFKSFDERIFNLLNNFIWRVIDIMFNVNNVELNLSKVFHQCSLLEWYKC